MYVQDKNADTSARWRDRGKFPESQPPPYEEGDWAPSQVSIFSPANYDYCLKAPILLQPERVSPSGRIAVPAHRNRKHRTHNNTSRGTHHHRKTRTHGTVPVSPRPSRQHSLHRHTKSEGEGDQEDEGDGVDDKVGLQLHILGVSLTMAHQMDWMSDRLTRLIEDGKRALNKEVVVISEAQEDEEDDGDGNWEEEIDHSTSIGHASGSNTPRHRSRPQTPGTTSYTSSFLSPPSSVPSHQQFLTAHSSYSSPSLLTPGCTSHNDAVDMARSYSSSHEDEYQWQSSELQQSMERARAAYLRNRP